MSEPNWNIVRHPNMLAPQENYGDIAMRIPRYRMVKYPPTTSPSSVVTVQPTSITQTQFIQPAAAVVNLNRTMENHQKAIPPVSAQSLVTFQDGSDIRSIQFQAASGFPIVDLQFADTYLNVIRPIEIDATDFLTVRDNTESFYPSNSLAAANVFPFSCDGTVNGSANAGTVNYLEPQHVKIYNSGATGVEANRTYLGDYKGTLFGCDRDTVWGTDMNVNIQYNFGQRLGYFCTGATGSTITSAATTQTSNITTNITFTNVNIFYAVQQNVNIRNALVEKVRSRSLKMEIPYTYIQQALANASSSMNYSYVISKNYGKNLKRILFAPLNGNYLGQYAFDHSNVNGSTITSFYTSIDGHPLVDGQLNCYNPNNSILPTGVTWSSPATFADDWREAQQWLYGKCNFGGYPTFQNQWWYQDTFGILPSDSVMAKHAEENSLDGFSMQDVGNHTYVLSAQSPALTQSTNIKNSAGVWMFFFSLFTRKLVIGPDGFYFDDS
jgi:hypothetical protein